MFLLLLKGGTENYQKSNRGDAVTTRTDVVVNQHLSPRVAEIASPSVEMTIQDSVDTLRKVEDSFSNGMTFKKLFDASGKEDLGGGVFVGLTQKLIDLKYAFQARTTPAESGTVTTGSSAPILGTINLIDATADFIAAGISTGSMVINYTDQSIADVVSVDSATQLTTKVLVNGIGNTYDVADVYDVFNIIQCEITGGNILAVDTGDVIVSPVLPTAFTQIIRTSSSSATLAEQADIQFASFGGGVTVELTSIYSGTVFPNGTPRQPVNNFTDALVIANERGFTQFFIIGDALINGGLDFTGFTFVGESQNKTLFTIDPSANVTNSEFLTATVTGTLDGGNVLTNCQIEILNFVEGVVQQCILNGTVTLSGVLDAHFLDCWSGVTGVFTPTIDFGGSGSGLSLRNYSGGIELTNKTGSESSSLDLSSGQIIIDDTVVGGTLILRGVGKWTNATTYAGTATIVNELISSADTQYISFDSGVCIDVINGVAGTVHPIGTPRLPSNNVADSVAIINSNKFSKLFVIGNIVFDTGDDVSGLIIIGQNANLSIVTVNAGAIVTNCEFRECHLTGVVDGGNIVREAILNNVSGFNGVAFETLIVGTLTIGGGLGTNLLNCFSGDPGVSTPTIDFGGSGQSLVVRGYSGNLELVNKTGIDPASLDIDGEITVNDTVTGGTVSLRGVGEWLNKIAYTGGANIVDQLISNTSVVDEWSSRTVDGVLFSEIMQRLKGMATGKIIEGPTGTFQVRNEADDGTLFIVIETATERNVTIP